MTITQWIVIIDGTERILTGAQSAEQAIRQVAAFRHCPESICTAEPAA